MDEVVVSEVAGVCVVVDASVDSDVVGATVDI